MGGENNATGSSCSPNVTGDFSVPLLFLVLPFHCFIIKILSINLRFESPRHIILLCLSISDCLQIAAVAVLTIVLETGDFVLRTPVCDGLRYTIVFTTSSTHFVSSLTLVALSIERYIACFHSYRVHEWLTNRRVIAALISFWLCGISCGGISAIPGPRSGKKVILTNSAHFGTIFVIITLPVSLMLIAIQSLLFCLSKRKLSRVQPTALPTMRNKINNIRRRQLKVAVVASIVVLSYLLCMLPGTCLIIIHKFAKSRGSTLLKKLLAISLGMLNTLLNPFIYGLGMLDTRQAILRDLRKLKHYVLLKLGIAEDV